ncbi:sensor histidine kinase [Streptomyces armeniacus]|uniref:Oxygen sensor histidine kinase NreB n=1 Tax=Streptomyces armeniacus TaxID=83291 RepID=A0A345XSY9_9ACTN|nr:sensor histidine kinase [Streptomyces armeniacus]
MDSGDAAAYGGERTYDGDAAAYGGEFAYDREAAEDEADPDARWLDLVLHAAFLLLLGGSVLRFVLHDPAGPGEGWIVALFAVFGLTHLLGRRWAPPPPRSRRPSPRHTAWLGSVLALWTVLLALAPSATWCAMPLLFTGLHKLPARAAVPLAAVLTVLVVLTELRVSTGAFNPNLVAAPVAVAAIATAVLVHSQRQAARQAVLIEDLVRTRRELAATERRAGILAERQRLAAEIHDTLAQSLSSQRMLLQAAERLWRTSPETAQGHVREAAEISSRGLAEARRFVRDLAPPELSGHTLASALRTLAGREHGAGLHVAFRLDGTPVPLPSRTEGTLLRVAQGALANVREHAAATRVVLTLTCLDDRVAVDIADNGRGLRARAPRAGATRGHGLRAMRQRVRQSGGTLTVESAPGEGTVVSASVPLAPRAEPRPERITP